MTRPAVRVQHAPASGLVKETFAARRSVKTRNDGRGFYQGPLCKFWKLLTRRQILLWRTKGEYATLVSVDEGRKRVLLIAACILAARKLMQWDGRNSPASEPAIADAITLAERIMTKIDAHWPARL